MYQIRQWIQFIGIIGLMAGVTPEVCAQFAVGARSVNLRDGYWHETFASAGGAYRDRRTSLYAAYWFRLKEKRVEFLPEVGYFSTFGGTDADAGNRTSGYYFQFNTDIYFLDFASDCNCPTFSKQNDFFQRGLFIEISPGFEMRSIDVSGTSPDTSSNSMRETKKFTSHGFKIAGALGLDIGVSDLLTVTPLVGLSFHTGTGWDGLSDFLQSEVAPDDHRHVDSDLAFNFGLRLLFRPDYVQGRR